MIVVTVVNKRYRQRGVYIGRPSIFGNYAEGSAESLAARRKHVQAYADYFELRIEQDPEFLAAMQNLVQQAIRDGYLDLQCWCAPLQCHGDVHQRWIINQLNADGYDAVSGNL